MKKLKQKKPVDKKQKKSITKNPIDKFIESLDLQSMWEKFSCSFNENGTPKYTTIWSFITVITKDKKQRDILYWLLGPTVNIEKGQEPKYSLPQYDWEQKRTDGFWFSSKNIENIKEDISRKASAYESVKQAGQVNVDTIAHLNQLQLQLAQEFGGKLFLPNLSQKENAMRATLYMQLLERIQTISTNAQMMFARTQGLDLSNLDAFFQMFGNQMGKTAGMLMGQKAIDVEGDKATSLEGSFAQVVKMITNKAIEYDLPLPESLADAIKETQTVQSKKAKPN